MRAEVMAHYGLEKPFERAGYYVTPHHKELFDDVRSAVIRGRLIAISGVIGSGKTVTLRHLENALREEKNVIVSRSLAVEKHNVKLATLISAIFYDLTQEKQTKIPTQNEKRDRELVELIKKHKKPVVLFVDEAHSLNGHTLRGLKHLMELVTGSGYILSIVLAGHPKLKNDLGRSSMEEIGYRTSIFEFNGIVGYQRDYLGWLLETCGGDNVEEIFFTDEAADLLCDRLKTPREMQAYLTQALEMGYATGDKPIGISVVESALARRVDDLEPTLTRHGYRIRDLVEQFDAKPAEIKAFYNQKLDPARAAELRNKMRKAGLPV
jgi:type II secretory pathway predicted ATPase ExeA